jgi:hypothetical protein
MITRRLEMIPQIMLGINCLLLTPGTHSLDPLSLPIVPTHPPGPASLGTMSGPCIDR